MHHSGEKERGGKKCFLLPRGALFGYSKLQTPRRKGDSADIRPPSCPFCLPLPHPRVPPPSPPSRHKQSLLPVQGGLLSHVFKHLPGKRRSGAGVLRAPPPSPHPRAWRPFVFGVFLVMGPLHASLILLLCQHTCLILRCLSSALLIYTVSVLIIQFSTP